MKPATLDAARAAKGKLLSMLEGMPELRGAGIAVLDGGYGIKLNLSGTPSCVIPDEVDGVPVVVSIVGAVRPL